MRSSLRRLHRLIDIWKYSSAYIGRCDLIHGGGSSSSISEPGKGSLLNVEYDN